MKRQTQVLVGAALVVLVVAGIVVAQAFFLPEKAIQVDEPMPQAETAGSDMASQTQTLAWGEFQGKTGHHVSGTVKLLRLGDDLFLRFENYKQTQGPDVFLYLTPSEDPDTRNEIREGRKILVDGGPDGGEITKEGNWSQKLPADLDPSLYRGVAIWCENFSVPFGSAPLQTG